MLVWSSISLLKKFLAHTWLALHISTRCLGTIVPRVGQIIANWPQTENWCSICQQHERQWCMWNIRLGEYSGCHAHFLHRNRRSLYFEIAYQLLIHPLTFSLGIIHPYKTCCLLTKSFLSSDFIAGKFLSYTKPGHAQQIGSDLLQAALKKHRTLRYQMFPSLSPYILKAK